MLPVLLRGGVAAHVGTREGVLGAWAHGLADRRRELGQELLFSREKTEAEGSGGATVGMGGPQIGTKSDSRAATQKIQQGLDGYQKNMEN